MSNTLAEKYADRIEAHLKKYPDKRSAVMPLLYLVQEEYGWLNEEAIREVAQLCELDPTHVKSIAGFYTMYRERPKGDNWIYVCTDLACALEGGDDLYEQILHELGLDHEHDTTDDEMFTVEHVMCLGACDRAPMMQCNFHFGDEQNGEYRNFVTDDGDIDMERVRAVLDYLREKPGSPEQVKSSEIN